MKLEVQPNRQVVIENPLGERAWKNRAERRREDDLAPDSRESSGKISCKNRNLPRFAIKFNSSLN